MRKLADRFVLEREVGSGGMARVFLGRDEVLDRPVAVKVLKPLHGETDIGIRFRREGRTAARLAHPGIVQVYDAGEAELDDREASYIVMEYLAGGDLKGLIDGRGRLPAAEIGRIGGEVCSGLAHAHGRGVVHRDIKPHNILLDDRGRAKVSDFGIARALDATHATRTGAYLGTALYSSPEQLQGHKVTPKADVYALGATMYQAATGEPLFTGSPIEIASQHVSKPPEPPNQRDPELDLDDDLEALILACLAKNPDDRPTAEEAGSRFEEAARVPEQTPETAAVPPPPATPTEHEPERGPQGGAERGPEREPRRERPAPTVASGGRVRRRFPGALAALALLAVLAVVGLLALPGLLPPGGNAAQNSGSQNDQAGADGSDGGGGGGSNDGGSSDGGGGGSESGNGDQDQAAAPEPTTASASASASSEPASSEPAGSGQTPDSEGGGSGGSGQQAQGSSPEQAAEQTIRDFYETAAGPNYQSSWDYLTSGYQQEIGAQESLTGQFQTLQDVQFTDGPAAQVNGDTATVSFSTRAVHTDRVETPSATATLVRQGDEWRIDRLAVG